MARKKISEFKAKKILYGFLEVSYDGISINTNEENYEDLFSSLIGEKKYVLKVDQGIKQRKKKGLVAFGVTKENIQEEINKLEEKGFNHFILEEFIEHDESGEHYLAIERVREGKRIHFSIYGGIEVEDNKDKIQTAIVKDYDQLKDIAATLRIPVETLESIATAFDDYYFSFLEINPLVVANDMYYFLDTAVEVDSTAEFFVNGAWNRDDFREGGRAEKTTEEVAIEKLKETTPAALSFQILNPNGSLFVLLSGGGASLVTADEIYQEGKGSTLANYGEYSGSPSEEETYMYVKNILVTLLHSTSSKKAIIVSGGVANFTDVRITFKGIIHAMSEVSEELKQQNVKVFVRRGGPHQKEGLMMMKEFLEKNDLLGEIHGPELVLTDVVKPAIEYIS
jgi:succinyl-CoA synthetase beta subunit